MVLVKKLAHDESSPIAIDENLDTEIKALCHDCFASLNDDFNTAAAIAGLFSLSKKINSFSTKIQNVNSIAPNTLELLKTTYSAIVEDILGLREEAVANNAGFISGLLDLYISAKAQRDYATVDKIRTYFKAEGLLIKDSKTGVDWQYEE